MTKQLGIFIMIVLLSSVTMAQKKKKYKEVKITRESETINVSSDKLWEIIGPGFAHASEWSTAVDFSAGKGAGEFEGATCSTRTCDVNSSGFSKISEKLVKYDQNNKELAYQIEEGTPGFVLLAENHWQVVEKGPNQSALKMTVTMHNKKFLGTLMGGMMKKNIKKLIPSVFNDLKIYAETGQISEEKQKRLAKLQAKN